MMNLAQSIDTNTLKCSLSVTWRWLSELQLPLNIFNAFHPAPCTGVPPAEPKRPCVRWPELQGPGHTRCVTTE